MPQLPVLVGGNGPSPAVSTVPRPPQPAAVAVCNFGNFKDTSYFGVCPCGKNIRTRASFVKTLPNSMSINSLINVVSEKKKTI